MSYVATFRLAKEMEINKLAAARMRCRYLDEELTALLNDGSEIALYWACETLDEMIWLLAKARYEEVETSDGRLTQEQINTAMQYPIEKLITFRNGKAIAFCHEDKKPSLSKHPVHNYCRCFVCNLSFSPIDILIKRDGYTFKEAVKNLL